MSLDIDEALAAVGGFRRFNFALFWLLCFSSFIPICFQGISIVFIGWTPPHHCSVPANQSVDDVIPRTADGTYESCIMYSNSTHSNDTVPCSDWSYDSGGYQTMVTEFDLVCDRDYFADASQILMTTGSVLTDTVGSYFSDKYGRKLIHIGSLTLIGVLGIGVSFAPSYTWIVILRLLIGMTSSVCTNSGITLMTEFFDSSRRTAVGMGLELVWTPVYFLPLPLAYFLLDWRYFQLIGSILSLLFITYIFFLPESPAWMVAYGKYQEAEDTLDILARRNGVRIPPVKILRPESEVEIPLVPQQASERLKKQEQLHASTDIKVPKNIDKNKQVPVLKLITDPKLRLHLLMSNWFWFSNTMVYYGLILNASLYGDRFFTYLLMGIAEIPAYITAYFVVDRFGRRKSMAAFYVLSGAALVITLFIPKDTTVGSWTQLALVLVARYAISGSFAVMVLFVRELFPTDIRSSSVAWGAVGGGLGSVVAPVTAYIGKVVPWLPNVCFGVTSLLAAFSVLPLPETTRKPLPLNLEELYEIYYNKKDSRKNNAKAGQPIPQ